MTSYLEVMSSEDEKLSACTCTGEEGLIGQVYAIPKLG